MQFGDVQIRPWLPEDASSLASLANNRKIWINVRDRFPYPYTIANAIEWIRFTRDQKPVQNLAVLYKGVLAGSVGVVPKEDVYRKNIEIGYIIGEAFWGCGIATAAVALLMEYIQHNFEVVRVYAEVFAYNNASMQVLRKNGFELEGIRKKAVIKDNVLYDDYVWVKFV